jgi:hypothetical protein
MTDYLCALQPPLVPELLKSFDQSCKSNPDALLENVVLDVVRTELSRGKPGHHAEAWAYGSPPWKVNTSPQSMLGGANRHRF